MILKYEAPYEIKAQLKGDVGLDIKSIEDVILRPGETRVVKTGLRVELPAGYEAQVRPRSSISKKGILIHLGTVDNEYRGEIGVIVTNLASSGDKSWTEVSLSHQKTYKIKKGDRVAQLVVKKYEEVELIKVQEVEDNTERGNKGYGSTGR